MFEVQAKFLRRWTGQSNFIVLYALHECPRAVGVLNSKRYGMEMIYQLADMRILEVCDLARSIVLESVHQRSRSIERPKGTEGS